MMVYEPDGIGLKVESQQMRVKILILRWNFNENKPGKKCFAIHSNIIYAATLVDIYD